MRDSAEEDEVRKVARVRTLTVLRGLDRARKASLLLFLYESGLIHKDMHDGIIRLEGADFSQADFSIANLSNDFIERRTKGYTGAWMRKYGSVNLEKAKLKRINFRAARLDGVNLNEADLSEAYLSAVDLKGAELIRADLHGVYYSARSNFNQR